MSKLTKSPALGSQRLVRVAKIAAPALSLVLLVAGLAGASPAMAAERTWVGGAGANWSLAGNWGGTAPVSGDSLVFTGSTVANTNNLTAGTSINGITFASGAGAFTLAGVSWGQNSITLTGAVVNNSSNLQTLTLPILLNATQTFNTGSAGLMIGDGTSGIISGAGGITKTGSGTLTLNQTNTYTGATAINEGTLLLAGGGRGTLSTSTAVSIASGAFFNLGSYSSTAGSIAGAGTISGGNVLLTLGGNNASTTFSGAITHTGSITKVGTGTLTLSGTNTYGITTISEGTVVFQKTSAKAGAVTAAAAGTVGLGVGGTGDYNATQVASLFNSTLTGFTLATGSGVAIDTTSGNFTQTTALTAARALTKLGANTLTFTTANSYNGGTKIAAGTVLANNSTGSALGTGNVTVESGARLDGNGSIGAFTTVKSGGQLGTGIDVGTLTFTQGLAFESGAILNVSLGSSSDIIRVTGGAFSAAGVVTVNLFNAGDLSAGTYTLIDATGALSSVGATMFAVGETIGGYAYTITSVGDQIQLIVSAIPEPSTYVALTGLAALAFVFARRLRRSSRQA